MQSGGGGPARMRYGQILDTSDKSAPLFHHPTTRKTHTWPRKGGDRRKCQTNTASPAEPGVSRIICAAGRKVRRFCAEHDPETRTGFQKNMLEQRDEIVFRSNLIGT